MLSYRVIGRHLRDARERLGLSQQEVAKRADISVAYYGKIERGDLRPNLDRLSDACEVLGLPIEEALKGARLSDAVLTNSEPNEDEFLEYFRGISVSADNRRKHLIMKVAKDIAEYRLD